MSLNALRITDMNDPLQQAKQNQFLRELRQMAFLLTFLDVDGGTADGLKAYNFDAVWVAYVSNGSADTEDTVAHSLDRIPNGVWVGLPDKAAVIYDSGTAWTRTSLFLKADVVSVTVNLLVF